MAGIFTLGRVVNSKLAYTSGFTNSNNSQLPHGAIKVRSRPSNGATAPIDFIAVPLDLSDISVPLPDEIVLITLGSNGDGIPQYYYSKIFNIHNTLNTNSSPNYFTFTQGEYSANAYENSAISSIAPTPPPAYISHTEQEIAPLQPYEGDRLISSRYGSAIRFSSNINKGQSSYFKSTMPWKGSGTNSPIIMLTSGLAKSNEFYTIEKPDEDKSYIYLASDQSITMTAAQQKIGTAQPPSNYSNGQIIIGSDRLFLNARRDDISLVSKTTVNVATPTWAMDMDKFFTIVESLTQELVNLAQGTATFATGAGPTGISTNLTALQNVLTQLKAMKQ
jgi:hypothetical protein